MNVDVDKIECEACGAQLDFASSSANSFEGEANIMAKFLLSMLVDCFCHWVLTQIKPLFNV